MKQCWFFQPPSHGGHDESGCHPDHHAKTYLVLKGTIIRYAVGVPSSLACETSDWKQKKEKNIGKIYYLYMLAHGWVFYSE